MKKIIGITILFLCGMTPSTFGTLQENKLSREGLLSASLNIVPGKYLYFDEYSLAIGGALEYFFDHHFSIRADGNFFLPQEKAKFQNHSGFLGFLWHISPSNFTPYIGLQSGFLFLHRENNLQEKVFRLRPSTSVIAGLEYFGQEFFYLFMNLSVHFAQDNGANSNYINLNEVQFTFGLGFMLNLKNR